MIEEQILDKMTTQRRLDVEIMNDEKQSTYGLLIRSEEKGRSITEIFVYALLGLSVVVSIVQYAREQNQLPVSVMGEPAEIQYISHQTPPDCGGQC